MPTKHRDKQKVSTHTAGGRMDVVVSYGLTLGTLAILSCGGDDDDDATEPLGAQSDWSTGGSTHVLRRHTGTVTA